MGRTLSVSLASAALFTAPGLLHAQQAGPQTAPPQQPPAPVITVSPSPSEQSAPLTRRDSLAAERSGKLLLRDSMGNQQLVKPDKAKPESKSERKKKAKDKNVVPETQNDEDTQDQPWETEFMADRVMDDQAHPVVVARGRE